MVKTEECRIIENKKVGPDFYRLKIIAPLIAIKARPGQFVHIGCSGPAGILLRRPFSINTVTSDKCQVSSQKQGKGQIQIIYKAVGKGTGGLAKKKPGETINAIGPLGNGFETAGKTGRAILVAGGMGVAPLLALAQEIKNVVRRTSYVIRKNKRPTPDARRSTVTALIGAKTKKELLCEDEFRKIGCDVRASTDDGSKGCKGLVSDLLKQLLTTHHCPLSTVVYACGPKPMLREISKIAAKHKLPCQVSLEEDMACGVGACYGCPVKTKQGYKLVCKDGPVFDAGEIVW